MVSSPKPASLCKRSVERRQSASPAFAIRLEVARAPGQCPTRCTFVSHNASRCGLDVVLPVGTLQMTVAACERRPSWRGYLCLSAAPSARLSDCDYAVGARHLAHGLPRPTSVRGASNRVEALAKIPVRRSTAQHFIGARLGPVHEPQESG